MTMKKLVNILLGASCIVALAFSTGAFIKVNAAKAAPVAGQPVDLTYAAEKALPAVVHIKYVQNSKVKTVEVQDDPFVQTPKREATGSGVIISADGYIVTNNHVVEGADELTVTLNDNSEYSARIIGTDKTTDLALIKVSAKNLPTLPIGDSDKLKVGEWVLAVGNPFNLSSTVTAGIVSAKARSLGANGVESFIQTDAAINAGNSGGALVNTSGELVGINAMLYSKTGSYSGYGFAIPTTIMNKVVEDLKKYGSVQRAVLDIQGQDVHNYIDMQKEKGEKVDLGTNNGIYIAKVNDGGAGEAAGLKEGDVITKVDNKNVSKMAELQEYLNSKRPGDKISITYLRNKKSITKTVTLKNAQGTTQVLKAADADLLGGYFKEITDKQKEELGINYGIEVVKVGDGALKESGIGKGFIIQVANEQPVRSVDDFQKIVKDASTSKDPVVLVRGMYPTGKRAYKVIQLSE